MKKYVLIFFMCLLFCNTIYGEEISSSDIKAMGAVLMDAKTGRVLWGKNETTVLPMASTTKIMTAIIALENGNLNDTVKVSKRASIAPQVKMNLQTGEEIKLEHLLYALMLQSSNDAAVAIAEHISGSVEEFCKTMTEKAKKLGANDTIFETPNGLDSENHHSTAYDMALITRYAIENEQFMKIINTKSYDCKSNLKSYVITNKNRLLNEYNGANGVKTGFTGKAGQCFVGAAIRDDMQLISVVLASGWGNQGKEQKWKDTKKILNYGFDNYKYENIITKGQSTGDILVDRSKTEKVGTYFEESFMLPLNKDEKESIYIDYLKPDVIRAPVEQGQSLGKAKVYINGKLQKEINLLADAYAERHDLKTSLEKIINCWLEMGTIEKVNIVLPEF